MDLFEAILTRRSIRRYTGERISDDDLRLILKAGFQAPSAHNHQPWHFIVVRDAALTQKVAERHQYAKILPQAGCGIFVCGDTTIETSLGFLVEDCSAAIQNILLAAHGLGLGAVWCGIYPKDDLVAAVNEIFKLPPEILPVGLVVVGHKAEEKESVDRYMESRVHYDRW